RKPIELAVERRTREADGADRACAQRVKGGPDLAPLQRPAFEPDTLAAAPAFEESPRVHGNKPTRHKGEGDDTEHQAREMVPVEQPAIGREPFAAPQLGDAEIKPEQREESAEHRGPDDGLAPQLTIAPQHRRVEPMRDGAEPVPEALRYGRAQHDPSARA